MDTRERLEVQTVVNNLKAMNRELMEYSRFTAVAGLKVKIHGIVERIELNIGTLNNLLT